MAIAGDPPPPPFLAVDHLPIPKRLLRKVWLRAAFSLLRKECAKSGDRYPGDDLVPPDVHGEFVPADLFYAEGSVWPRRLEEALRTTEFVMREFVEASVLSADQRQSLFADARPDAVVQEILRLSGSQPLGRSGLAQFLAERGLLPMYGMPTRVRELYTGLSPVPGPEPVERRDFVWSTMDRDVELAVRTSSSIG